jgi:outer membrane protein OmpA-like peptidoglycan-associated protein
MYKPTIKAVFISMLLSSQVMSSNFEIVTSGLSGCTIKHLPVKVHSEHIVSSGSFSVFCPVATEYEVGTEVSRAASGSVAFGSEYELYLSKEKMDCNSTLSNSIKIDSSKLNAAPIIGIGRETWNYCVRSEGAPSKVSSNDYFDITLENTVLKSTPPDEVLDVYFKNDSYSLADMDAAGLDILFNVVSQGDIAAIVINGHASSLGAFKYNVKLSGERVKAVRNEMMTMLGISPKRIYTASWGEMRHAAIKTMDGNEDALNRRVTVSIYYKRDCSPEWLGSLMGDEWESKRMLCSERKL